MVEFCKRIGIAPTIENVFNLIYDWITNCEHENELIPQPAKNPDRYRHEYIKKFLISIGENTPKEINIKLVCATELNGLVITLFILDDDLFHLGIKSKESI